MKKLLSPLLIIVLFLKYGDLCMLRSNNYFFFNSTNSSFNHLHSDNNSNITRSFSIDYEKDTFVKNSAPFQFISATFNLYNVPHELWRDRLNTFWAVGLNTIQIHVLWDQHEPYPDVYDFEDEKNISRLLSLSQEFGFNVILRTGALTDNDGLPWWITEKESDYQVNKAKEWFNALLPRIVPFLYKNGGPIIVVQHEILYDVYFSCDNTYLNEIKEIFNKTLGDDVVYFAKVESPFDVNAFGPMCNQTRDVYPVSAADLTDTNEMVQNQRSYSAHGPLVNTDFNIGWTDSWGKPPFRFDLAASVERFLESQSLKANINLKGFFGGTNFGFRKDADKTTCSDHDSAISESGDITHKFLVLRVSIARFFQVSSAPVLKSSLKHAFGMVDMKYYIPLVDVILSTSSKCVKSDTLPTFESLGQGYGVILYSTDLSQFDLNNTVLSVSGIKGRAYVQIGYKSFGVINSRDQKNITLDISLRNETNQNLFIVVENLDNYNQYDVNANLSNIKSEPSVSINGEALKNWNSCITDNFIPNFRKKLSHQKSVDLVSKYAVSDNLLSQKNLSSIDFSIPGVYIGEFNGSDVDYDTFLRMDNFERGFALIQSNESITNLGQYWPHVGPQVTLYTPSVFLTKSSKNHVILFELEKSIGCQSSLTCNVEFIDHPITN